MKKQNKYRVNDYVLINKIFSTENNKQGVMETIEKPLIARVTKVQNTSTGPSYKLELLTEPERSLKIMYWESDILSAYDI